MTPLSRHLGYGPQRWTTVSSAKEQGQGDEELQLPSCRVYVWAEEPSWWPWDLVSMIIITDLYMGTVTGQDLVLYVPPQQLPWRLRESSGLVT